MVIGAGAVTTPVLFSVGAVRDRDITADTRAQLGRCGVHVVSRVFFLTPHRFAFDALVSVTMPIDDVASHPSLQGNTDRVVLRASDAAGYDFLAFFFFFVFSPTETWGVSDTRVRCRSDWRAVPGAEFSPGFASFDTEHFSLIAAAMRAAVLWIRPAFGSLGGGTALTLHGVDFSFPPLASPSLCVAHATPRTFCKFGDAYTLSAAATSADPRGGSRFNAAACVSPPVGDAWRAGYTSVEFHDAAVRARSFALSNDARIASSRLVSHLDVFDFLPVAHDERVGIIVSAHGGSGGGGAASQHRIGERRHGGACRRRAAQRGGVGLVHG